MAKKRNFRPNRTFQNFKMANLRQPKLKKGPKDLSITFNFASDAAVKAYTTSTTIVNRIRPFNPNFKIFNRDP
jgi:hypothetical protein